MLRHVLDRVGVFAGSARPLQPGTGLAVLLGHAYEQALTFLWCDADGEASDRGDDLVEVGLCRGGDCFTGCLRLCNKFDFPDHKLCAVQYFHLEAVLHIIEQSLDALGHRLSLGAVLHLRV